MDFTQNLLLDAEKEFEDTFRENVTFSNTSVQEKCEFSTTLAFVKGFSETWDNLSNVSLKYKSTQQCSQTINNSQKVPTHSLKYEVLEVDPGISLNADLECWNLPSEIIKKYNSRGISRMFQWQVECLSNSEVLHNNKNLIYSAPTSAGKTLVAEILMLKALIEKKKKALVILPFVSVVREKTFYFQEILSTSGIRVEGFMGTHMPPGGYQAVNVAVCTIEKANSLINHMLEDGNISDLGIVVVDELHLLGDPHRGYILELLLTKILYMSKKNSDAHIQIVGMSATLPNLSTLSDWLDAELYKTDFRPIPLNENCLIGDEILNSNFECVSKINQSNDLLNDTDHIIHLVLETLSENCSVLIFCPTKNWCENLAQRISTTFRELGYGKSEHSQNLRKQLDPLLIKEVIQQLQLSPVGLDVILHETISFGVAFHHAGLTMDERDIIESAFKRSAVRVLIATSTLSSGVNLPARRVIIRSATFYSKPINIMTYKQMIGRAGRMGIDSVGESILIGNDRKTADKLLNGGFEPITSCLEGEDKLMRAILESIASEIASNYEDINLFTKCTLLLHSSSSRIDAPKISDDNLNELVNYELIRICENIYSATALGKACLSSSMSPQDGLTLFKELQKARECFVLETDLHMIYLVTPFSICQQWGDINWVHFLKMWDVLSNSMKRVGELVGIHEGSIYRFMNKCNHTAEPSVQKKIQICKRFYTALALQDLVNEVPLSKVANKFSCSRGMLQSLQQSAATFAGMVTAFSRKLGWKSFELLVSQFQDRLHFGIQVELIDLMKLQSLNSTRARALYDSNIKSVCQLAVANVFDIEKALYAAIPFESEKERDGDIKYDILKRNEEKNIWLTGKKGVSVNEAAKIIIKEAQIFLQLDMGIKDIEWNHANVEIAKSNSDDLIIDKNISPVKECIQSIFNVYYDELNVIPEHKSNTETVVHELKSNYCDSTENDDNIFEDSLIIDTQLNGILNNDNLKKSSNIKNISTVENKPGPSVDTSFGCVNQYVIKRRGSDILNISDDIFVSPTKLSKQSSINSDCDSFSLEFSKRLLFEDTDYNSVEIPEIMKNKLDKSNELFNFVKSCDNRNIFDKTVLYLESCDIFSLFIEEAYDSKPAKTIGCNIAGNKIEKRVSRNCVYHRTYVNSIAIYVPKSFLFWFDLQKLNEVKISEILKFLSNLLNDQNKTVILDDTKYTLRTLMVCCKINILPNCEDPVVAEWILGPEDKRMNLYDRFKRHFDVEIRNLSEYLQTKLNWEFNALETCVGAWANCLVMQNIKQVINQKHFWMLEIFKKEMKFLSILAEYEISGIEVNKKMAASMIEKMKGFQYILELQASSLAGQHFKLSCPASVAKVLGLYNGRKIKTDKKVLEKIENPLAQIIMYWRKLNSVLTKTLYPLTSFISKVSGKYRVNQCYLTFSSTGRLSIAEPNIQCVPRNFTIPHELLDLDDSKIGHSNEIKCRNIFIAGKGKILISADYSQLELRLLAHFSKDTILLKVLHGKGDVFKAIAAKWKSIQEDEVDDNLRQTIKQLCYGMIYGIGNNSLAQMLDISELEANEFVNTFYSAYPQIKPFMESSIKFCQKNGFVETLEKRRRYLPLINSTFKSEKAHAERQAVNTIIQGTAVDILKSSLISLYNTIKRDLQGVDINLMLLLHDEIIFEIPEDKVNEFQNLLIDCMTKNQNLLVPLPVKIKVGKQWGDMQLL